MSDCDCRTPMKAVLWEEAKGKLRALVAVHGSYPHSPGTYRHYNEIDDEVERFIKSIEDKGLQE